MNRPVERYKPDNSGLYPIHVNSKYGFMDRSGKTVITAQFDSSSGFSEGLAQVRVGTKSGYINTKGAVVITPQFDEAGPFQYGRAAVKLGNRFGFIDKDGKYISSPDFSWVGSFSGDLAPVKTADGVMAFVNRSGKIVLSGKFDSLGPAGFTAGLAPASSGGKWGFIDATGKWIIDPQFEYAGNFADGLAPVIVGGRFGYADQKGKFVINPQYDFGGEFYEGYAIFANAGKWGIIDTKGRVKDAKFTRNHFSDGLAPVQTEDGWGFIDRTGKMVVTPQFDSADAFQNGLARVTALGKEAYITTTGAFVVDPFPGTNIRAERARIAAEATWTDSSTHLMWALRDNGSDVHWDAANRYCSSLSLGGFTGWRLPEIEELAGIYDPAVNLAGTYNGNNITWHIKGGIHLSGGHWSATKTSGSFGPLAWLFDFSSGQRGSMYAVYSGGGDFANPRALCVRRVGA
jgi:hypothetical protein